MEKEIVCQIPIFIYTIPPKSLKSHQKDQNQNWKI